MKAAVAHARAGHFQGAIDALDKVVSGEGSDGLAASLVAEWTRLKPETRMATNILVLENDPRRLVNEKVRQALQREGVVAAQEIRLHILSSATMSEHEKRHARFYFTGQVVTFARDTGSSGIARNTEYRVIGLTRDASGRQLLRLVDGQGRETRWDPRTTRASHVNVFREEARSLSVGDRVQWRLVNHELALKNAERGTVQELEGTKATIRWDRSAKNQTVDLSVHRTWDHGYAETGYSAQSKTYDRVYMLAPAASPLVNAQNFYTAITRARFGVKLWTEDPGRLIDRLDRLSGEKSSALEGLGRIAHDHVRARQTRDGNTWAQQRDEHDRERRDRATVHRVNRRPVSEIAQRAGEIGQALDQLLNRILVRGPANPARGPGR